MEAFLKYLGTSSQLSFLEAYELYLPVGTNRCEGKVGGVSVSVCTSVCVPVSVRVCVSVSLPHTQPLAFLVHKQIKSLCKHCSKYLSTNKPKQGHPRIYLQKRPDRF